MPANSYDNIIEAWQKHRDVAPINTPIVQFAQRVKPNGNILDIGCGTGRPIAQFLSDGGFQVTGIDASINMIRTAQGHRIPRTQFIHLDLFDFHTDQPFDGIIAWDSLFHVSKEKQRMIYPKISELLLPGGYFLFTHGLRDDEHVDTMFGESFYYSALDKEEVLTLIYAHNFEIVLSIEHYAEGQDTRDWVVLLQKK